MTDNELSDLFREMRDEPVPADSLALVRLRLEDRIRRRGHWKVASWVMAGAMLVLVALLTQPHSAIRKPEKVPVAALGPAAPPVELPEATPPLTVRPAIRRKLHQRPQPRPEAVTIRIETPDPDVVILLVSQ